MQNMRPLILEFAEKPKFVDFDKSLIEYSEVMNLSVLKNTRIPAISNFNMSTETFTKSIGEPTDSDTDLGSQLKVMLGTETMTHKYAEVSDSDRDRAALQLLMSTQTITESVEPTDSDR